MLKSILLVTAASLALSACGPTRAQQEQAARVEQQQQAIAAARNTPAHRRADQLRRKIGISKPEQRDAAIRAAAEAEVDAEWPPSSDTHTQDRAAADALREERVMGEVEVINDMVARIDQHNRTQTARMVCEARGQMVQAAFPDGSLLGLNAVLAGVHARNACFNLHQQTGIMPGF